MFGHKNNYEKILKEFEKSPSLVSISLDDIESLPEKVLNSSVNKNYVYGVLNSAILLGAVEKNLDKHCPLKGDSLICKTLFFAHAHNKPVDYTTIGATFYFKVYFGNDMLYVYELDYCARVLSVDTIKFSDIVSIGNTPTHLLLRCIYNNSKFENTFLFVKKGEDDNILYDALIKNGLNVSCIESPGRALQLLMTLQKIG